MPDSRASIINDPAVRAALQQAWLDSQPGVTGGHEEGGFILRDAAGALSVTRWPIGSENEIFLPPHAGCKISERDIVASFHTHPNTGRDFLQEPSETDCSAIRDDPDLKGAEYEGEFVISQTLLYRIAPTGQVSAVGRPQDIFAET